MQGQIQTYKIVRKQINHLLYMDDIKLFTKNKNGLETLKQVVRIYNEDMGIEFGGKNVPC